jgi:excinuclease UvrABC nuclease subunit
VEFENVELPLQAGFYVYRFWDIQGRCLYVGRTRSIAKRIGQHVSSKWWWPQVHSMDVVECVDRKQMKAMEATQVCLHLPSYNIYKPTGI